MESSTPKIYHQLFLTPREDNHRRVPVVREHKWILEEEDNSTVAIIDVSSYESTQHRLLGPKKEQCVLLLGPCILDDGLFISSRPFDEFEPSYYITFLQFLSFENVNQFWCFGDSLGGFIEAFGGGEQLLKWGDIEWWCHTMGI